MGSVTYFVALPFGRDEDGNLCAGEAVEAQSELIARSRAARLATAHEGAVAFSRTGDPDLGDFEAAVILVQYGEVPADVAAYVW
ncbi:hypothetical protein QO058_01465 [Bosea vestrisii]|nr:hypothetical protein [Bosea vestrisii]WID96980.1 hypothetical protein QO058_01465 [Bosea vestrisii]